MWRLSGNLNNTGMPGVLQWDGRRMTGDLASLAAVDAYLLANETVAATPTGPFVAASKSDEVSALLLAYVVFGGAGDLTGEPPDLPGGDLPDGAIA